MSHITLINHTNGVVRLAIFRQSVRTPTLATIAWRIAVPPPGGGNEVIQIPLNFSVLARYSSRPANPSDLDTETAAVPFAETTAAFTIDAVESADHQASAAVITQRFTDLVLDEVRVVNNYSIGCEVRICQDGDPIYAPQVLWPGGLFIENIRSSFHVAVVSQSTASGQKLIDEEISQTRIEALEGSTIIVNGSMWTGYSLTQG